MRLIDTHGHLNLPPLFDDWAAIVDRCQSRDLAAVILPGTNLATSRRAVELAAARPGFLWAGVGLHPTSSGGQNLPAGKAGTEVGGRISATSDYEPYRQLARQSEVVAVGEVGLDTYRLPASNSQPPAPSSQQLDLQERVLQHFIQIAQEVKKPLILHCRGSKYPGFRHPTSDIRYPNLDPHDRLIQILTEVRPRPGFVVHCYQGTVEQAERYLALGGLISFTGTITYTDDPVVTNVVRAVPLDRLMIETDSPFLSPVPYRGETNEPWKVVEVARRVAELKGLSLEEVAAATTQNATRFFGLSL